MVGFDASAQRRALQPVRSMFRAQALYGLLVLGILDALQGGPKTVAELAGDGGLDTPRLEALLRYATVEGLLRQDNQHFSLGPESKDSIAYSPWLRLLVGGYGRTLMDLPQLIADSSLYGARNLTEVAIGSSGISAFDTIPLVHGLLAKYPNIRSVADLGSADAAYLVSLCQGQLSRTGIAVEPHPESALLAEEAIQDAGLSRRISVRNCTLQDFVLESSTTADLYLFAFVLQEVIAQSGEAAVRRLLGSLSRRAPQGHLLVIEIDAPQDSSELSSELGLAYYNPYFLLHAVTNQTLLPISEWITLIETSGFELLERATTDPSIDPTGFEVALLFRSTGDD